MITQARPHLRVEVMQASRGDRLWAWAIYRGVSMSPIDGSQAIFPSRAVARRVGTCIKDAIPARHPAPFPGVQ